MKTYSELTVDQQEKAAELALNSILAAVVEGGIRFTDKHNNDNLQEAIDAAIEEAERMRTPWFAHEHVMGARYKPRQGHITEDDGLWPVGEALRGMASCDAEDALYAEPGEPVVHGVLG